MRWPGSWSKQMNDWMVSGAEAPCSDQAFVPGENSRLRKRHRISSTFRAGILTAAIILPLPFPHASARDNGQYAGTSPELKAWFDSLRSGKGPCCSDADGSAVSDVDWESNSGHYRVRLEGKWLDVPDEAVITGPNRVGRTMVWPMRGDAGPVIRCFMPGSMT
jgi:hypothetical protein